MKLDLNIAAQMQFMSMVHISMSEEYKQYINQTKVINTKVESTQLSTIGGLPPSSGNWNDWVNTVKGNLAPISYKLTAVIVLFNYIPGLDVAGAVNSFLTFFNFYCAHNPCPPITPDRPDPKELTAVFSLGPEYQGPKPGPVKFNTDDGQISVGMRMSKFLMGFNNHLEAFQIILSDGIREHALPHIGDTHSLGKQYVVPEGDEVFCITLGVRPVENATAFHRLLSVQFKTRLGVESQVFAGSGTVTEYHVACPESQDFHVVGLHGTYNNSAHGIDSVGLNFMKEIIKP